jgi:xanthine/CO dehydrogenase XdhC/CoxF family maturation factor
MNELSEIIKAYDVAKQSGKACVLATVVHLEGSSYRRPGARMLVLEDGLMIGAISGGCLEGDALKKALLTFTEKKSRLVTYDTSDEDDATMGVQLGCEGIIQVLFEYIHFEMDLNPIELLRKSIAKRQNAAVVTLFDLTDKKRNQIGTCLFHGEDGTIVNGIAGIISDSSIEIDIVSYLQNEIQSVFQNRQSTFNSFRVVSNTIQVAGNTINAIGHTINVFIQFMQPSIAIVVVGAGNDAIPLMQIGNILGWEVSIVDGRNTHAKVDRFINACQVIVSNPEKVLEKIAIDDRTCFVLMTHNYKYDLAMMKALLQTSVPYIGVLGPKKKLQKILDELIEQGMTITNQMVARIYGPTGLDIGAETAEEIAASIIAEIQAVFNNKQGHMLKWKQDLIHS